MTCCILEQRGTWKTFTVSGKWREAPGRVNSRPDTSPTPPRRPGKRTGKRTPALRLSWGFGPGQPAGPTCPHLRGRLPAYVAQHKH